jgi:7-cyano-7-deazaguanine reductase
MLLDKATVASVRRAPRAPNRVEYRRSEPMADYTAGHARAGVRARLPKLETWPNQFPGYEITTEFPEYTSVCPKTGLPDYGKITIEYQPRKLCLELKALKMYLLAYRNLGIFYENAVNRILRDIVEATRPDWCVVRGEFTPRGGLTTTVEARWPRPGRARRPRS